MKFGGKIITNLASREYILTLYVFAVFVFVFVLCLCLVCFLWMGLWVIFSLYMSLLCLFCVHVWDIFCERDLFVVYSFFLFYFYYSHDGSWDYIISQLFIWNIDIDKVGRYLLHIAKSAKTNVFIIYSGILLGMNRCLRLCRTVKVICLLYEIRVL